MAEAVARELRMAPRQHLALSAFWFANQLHWGALATILIESQSARMAQVLHGGPKKAAITGLVFGVGSVVAAVTPPIVGAFSDRCCSPLGSSPLQPPWLCCAQCEEGRRAPESGKSNGHGRDATRLDAEDERPGVQETPHRGQGFA